MSRDIDRLVQHHIISRSHPNCCEQCGGPLKTTAEDGCVRDWCSVRSAQERTSSEPDFYSSDIAAAWRVLDVLRPVHIELNYFPAQDAWQCNIGNGPLTAAYHMTQEQWQPTAPLAICIAALNAVGRTLSEKIGQAPEGRESVPMAEEGEHDG